MLVVPGTLLQVCLSVVSLYYKWLYDGAMKPLYNDYGYDFRLVWTRLCWSWAVRG